MLPSFCKVTLITQKSVNFLILIELLNYTMSKKYLYILYLEQIKSKIWATCRVFSMDISNTHCQSIYASLINELLSLKFMRPVIGNIMCEKEKLTLANSKHK